MRIGYWFLVVLTMAVFKASGQATLYGQVVQYYSGKQNFNGAVLVARNGKIEYLYGGGIANRTTEAKISATTKFRICSITKTFTVALILQLVAEGKLTLGGTIGQYLPEYKGEGRDKVSLHHLITFSSGIPNCEGGRGLEVYQTPLPVDSFIARYCSGKLKHTPGLSFEYDNGAYIILGRIIEKVTGKSYRQNLQERIFTPLGMNNTDLLEHAAIVKGLASSYLYSDSTRTFYNDPPYYIESYFSSGALYATVEDLLKFDQAIFEKKLFSSYLLDTMLTAHPHLWNVAYGFWVTSEKYGNVEVLAADRQGAIMGSNTTWLHLIKENITVIVFSNTNATNINELRQKLVLAALGQPFGLPAGAIATAEK